MIKIHIDEIPSSNNRNQGKGGIKRAMAYQDEKKLWKSFIWVMHNQMKINGELNGLHLPFKQATVILHYHFKTKARRDPDNYSGKMILDALKDNGFIADDSFKEIDIFPMANFGQVKKDSTDIYILERHLLREMVQEEIRAYEIIKQIKKGER